MTIMNMVGGGGGISDTNLPEDQSIDISDYGNFDGVNAVDVSAGGSKYNYRTTVIGPYSRLYNQKSSTSVIYYHDNTSESLTLPTATWGFNGIAGIETDEGLIVFFASSSSSNNSYPTRCYFCRFANGERKDIILNGYGDVIYNGFEFYGMKVTDTSQGAARVGYKMVKLSLDFDNGTFAEVEQYENPTVGGTSLNQYTYLAGMFRDLVISCQGSSNSSYCYIYYYRLGSASIIKTYPGPYSSGTRVYTWPGMCKKGVGTIKPVGGLYGTGEMRCVVMDIDTYSQPESNNVVYIQTYDGVFKYNGTLSGSVTAPMVISNGTNEISVLNMESGYYSGDVSLPNLNFTIAYPATNICVDNKLWKMTN